jgi:predicted permease
MNFVLIAVCLIAGPILRSSGILPENAHKGINAWILYIALPAVSLLYIPAIDWNSALILPVVMPLIVWFGAWFVLKLPSKLLALDSKTRAALLLTSGLGNTSFVGFPLTQAYFGDEGLRIAVICDQLSFITLSTFGVVAALSASRGEGAEERNLLKNILRFPPFLAFVVALTLPRFMDFAPLNPLLTKLAATLVPLALFSVGMQIRLGEWTRELPSLALGLFYKLLIAPAFVLCAALAFRLGGVIAKVSVFEAAMAPMVTSAILASEYRLNPRVSSLMVSAGILISIATTGLWWFILRAVL